MRPIFFVGALSAASTTFIEMVCRRRSLLKSYRLLAGEIIEDQATIGILCRASVSLLPTAANHDIFPSSYSGQADTTRYEPPHLSLSKATLHDLATHSIDSRVPTTSTEALNSTFLHAASHDISL